jgi:signal transduction histidine kinase
VIRRPTTAPVALAAAATVALVAIDVARQVDLGVAEAALWFFAASTCVGIGAALAVARWPERRRMAVLILTWLFVAVAGDLGVEWPASRLATTLWMLATAVLPATFALMVLAYPAGRLRGRERDFVALTFAAGVAWMSFPLLFGDLRTCPGCSPHVSSLLYTGTTSDLTIPAKASAATFVVLGAIFLALVVRRIRVAPPGARVTLLPFWLAAIFVAADFVVERAAVIGGWDGLMPTLDWVDRVSTLALPLAILAGIAAIRRRRGPVGDLVVELGAARPGEVRAALRRALVDPTPELALWLPERGAFVDEQGEPVAVVELGPGRAVTRIDPLAALVHDERLLGQRPLLEAAGSAARLALENARLQAQLRAQLAELRASRARLVAAADAERRRLERDLHDGAQQRLLALGLALQLVRDDQGDLELLDQAEAELQLALPSCATSRAESIPRSSASRGWPRPCGASPTAPRCRSRRTSTRAGLRNTSRPRRTSSSPRRSRMWPSMRMRLRPRSPWRGPTDTSSSRSPTTAAAAPSRASAVASRGSSTAWARSMGG